MRCDYCGAAYDEKDNFCRNCGVRLRDAADLPAGPEPPPPAPSPRVAGERRRTKRALAIAAASIVFVALLAVVVVQLMPDIIYLSMGGKPKNLGVTYGEADYQSILAKTGVVADEPPAGEDRSAYTDIYTGTKDIDWTLTEQELTAWLNLDRQPGYWPVADVQMKLHADNVIEVSFSVDPKKLMTFESVMQHVPGEIQSFLAGMTKSIPVYAKARFAFAGPKQVGVDILSFEAAGMSISAFGMGEQADQILESVLNEEFSSIEQVNVDEFTTEEGSLHMKGTWYQEIGRVPAE